MTTAETSGIVFCVLPSGLICKTWSQQQHFGLWRILNYSCESWCSPKPMVQGCSGFQAACRGSGFRDGVNFMERGKASKASCLQKLWRWRIWPPASKSYDCVWRAASMPSMPRMLRMPSASKQGIGWTFSLTRMGSVKLEGIPCRPSPLISLSCDLLWSLRSIHLHSGVTP